MSSKALDLSKLTVDDLFRAKEAQRKRLAKLPFEEKIKIVKRLQTVSAAIKGEKVIFESFLRTCPDFAGESIEEWDVVEDWYANRGLDPPAHPYDQRPDIIARTASGKIIGVELKSWVNLEQIATARKEERIRENILKAIGEQPPNETKNIGYVWLSAKEVRFDRRDEADFREQIFSLIQKTDEAWSKRDEWKREWTEDIDDFTGFPLLRKYLLGIRFHPVGRNPFKKRWIQFPSPGGAYSPNEMLETLSSSLVAHKNDGRYKDLKTHAGLDEMYLLVHYDFKAFAYNTPYDAPNFGFEQVAKLAKNWLAGDGGYFDRVFLFKFLWGEEVAYRIL